MKPRCFRRPPLDDFVCLSTEDRLSIITQHNPWERQWAGIGSGAHALRGGGRRVFLMFATRPSFPDHPRLPVVCVYRMEHVLLAVLVTLVSVLGQEAASGSVLELTGDEATVRFGRSLSLVHDASNDKLSCSGALEAADLRIAGSSVTVAQMMSRLASLESLQSQMGVRLSSLEAQIATLEAPPSPPPLLPLPAVCVSTQSGCLERIRFKTDWNWMYVRAVHVDGIELTGSTFSSALDNTDGTWSAVTSWYDGGDSETYSQSARQKWFALTLPENTYLGSSVTVELYLDASAGSTTNVFEIEGLYANGQVTKKVYASSEDDPGAADFGFNSRAVQPFGSFVPSPITRTWSTSTYWTNAGTTTYPLAGSFDGSIGTGPSSLATG